MPVGFNSPARNLFLFGTSGEQVVQNFFKNVDLSGSNDKCFRPSDIRLAANGDYFIAGTSQGNTSADKAFVDRRSFNTETSIETLVSQFGVNSTQVNVSTTLTALEVDLNFKLILCGKTGNVPWVGRFSDTGVADWISTSNTADVEYSGIAFDSNGIYLCGHTPTASGESYAVVEKYDLNGSPLWGKTIRSFGDDAEIERVDVNSKGELIAVGKIADNTKNKGYISKIDTYTGEILWSRTLEHGNKTGSFYDSVFCTDVHIDENDEIFISGNIVRGASVRGFYVKYSPEGNMILQRENGADQFSTTTDIYSDGLTGQTTIGGTYITTGGDYRATISKYSRQGVLLWRRYYRTDDGGGEVRLPNFHAEGAFYYVVFNDDVFDSNNLTPNSYLYGKVSSSGNGLGGFVYDAQDSKFIDYEITSDISNEIGKLSDGSVRNDTSDFISYPYSGNRIAFDDLATVIANKKVQVDDVGIYEESGSPSIRPADFQEVNLLPEKGVSLGGSNPLLMDFRGSSYTGIGSILDESGNGKEMGGNAIWTSGTEYFQFNSSTPTVTETTNPLGASRSTPFTMEVWAARGTSASWQTVMTITNSWTQIAFDAAGQIRCGRNGGGGGINASTSVTANVDQWYHIVMTYDGNDNGTNAYITIYVDGVAVTGATDMGVNSFGDNGQYIRLGTHAGGGEYFNGRVGEVRVYDRELTSDEVLNNYLGSKDRYHGGGNTGSGLVINDGNLWADSSSKKNDAVIGITQFQPTYNSGYFTYNGNTTSGDYVRLPNLVHDHVAEPDWSYEMWFRTSSGHGVLFGQQMNPFPNVTNGWVPALHLNSDGTLRAEPFWTTTGTSSADVTSGTNYRDGNWHHVVVTRENNIQRMYVDGSLETTGSSHIPSGYNSVYYYFIGAGKINPNRTGSVDGQSFFNGDIGDFRFYKRPLTAGQVFQNYNATKTKYTGEAPDTAPRIGPGIVYDSNLLLNYDFGNRATYDSFANTYYTPNIISSEIKITASDGAAGDSFGEPVAVGSGRIVVGAPGDDDDGTNTGSAYVFDFDGNQLAKITGSDATTDYDNFGSSVAVGNNKIVVGCAARNSNTGAIYIYDLDGTNEVIVTASDAAAGDLFGCSVAVGSDKIVVGARFDNDNNQFSSGSVYIYDLDGTNEVKITASDPGLTDYFGDSVAVGSDRIVVGAYADDDTGGFDFGSAYIFDLDGNQLAKITASDGAVGDNFGWSVAVGNNKIVVGAWRDDDNGSDSGSAYIYDLDGSNEIKITASDGAAGDNFGYSVAVGSDRIVVGARHDADRGDFAGAAYIFDLDGNQLSKITATDTAAVDRFANRLAVGDDKLVIGAFADDDNGNDSGSAYVYSLKLPLPTTVKNLSSSSYTGTINGATFNSAGYFETTADAWVGAGSVATGTSDMTIEQWVRANSFPVTFHATFYSQSSNVSGFYGVGYGAETSGWFFGDYNGSVRNVATSGTTASVNTWYHFVARRSSGNLTVHINGVDVTSTSASTSISFTAADPRIGNNPAAPVGEYWDGDIAETRIYNRALSSTEISQNFNATRAKYGV